MDWKSFVQGCPWLNWGPKAEFYFETPTITKWLYHKMPFKFKIFISRYKSNEQSLSTMEQAFYRCTRLHCLDAKSSMRSSYDSCCATSQLMLMIARPLKRSCTIGELQFWKASLSRGSVTGRVTAMQRAIHRFGYSSCKRFSLRNDNVSRAVVCVGSL